MKKSGVDKLLELAASLGPEKTGFVAVPFQELREIAEKIKLVPKPKRLRRNSHKYDLLKVLESV